MTYPQISESELRRRLRGLGQAGKQLDMAIVVWQTSGMTVDEVLHIRWQDVDLERGIMRVPELPPRVYAPHERWLEARAFGPEEEAPIDPMTLPSSALERVLPEEHPELVDLFEPNRGLSRELDLYGQAMLVGWLRLAERLSDPSWLTNELREYCTDAAVDGYQMEMSDPERSVIATAVGATINGALEDLANGGEARLQDVADQVDRVLGAIQRQGGNPYGESALIAQVFIDAREYDYDFIKLGMLFALVPAWQQLLWFSECALRRGAVVTPGRSEPLIGDGDEQLTYLLRLGAEQPGLAAWPELARFIPRRAEGLLPMTEDAYVRFRKHGIAPDAELANRLTEEIIDRRHYTVSSVSVIELEELGIKRIVLTPEEQPLPSMTGTQAAFHLGFWVDHVAGGFYGRAQVSTEAMDHYGGRRGLVTAPAILVQSGEFDPGERSEKGLTVPDSVAEAMAAVELIVLSAWRDLVVPEVREQHYEVDRIRKAKGKKRARAAKRGDVEIVRYIPRRLVMLREERERSAHGGQRQPRRLYSVGAFSRRLPDGQKRSKEAEDFAKESGIPLAPWQTVVKPHWRGGTAEDRERTAEDPELDVRYWRSWSAIDLLRTRLARS